MASAKLLTPPEPPELPFVELILTRREAAVVLVSVGRTSGNAMACARDSGYPYGLVAQDDAVLLARALGAVYGVLKPLLVGDK